MVMFGHWDDFFDVRKLTRILYRFLRPKVANMGKFWLRVGVILAPCWLPGAIFSGFWSSLV